MKLAIIVILSDSLFFSFSNPVNAPSFISIVACLLLLLTIYVITVAFARVIRFLIPISSNSQKRLALSATLLFTYMIIMQSIGQLSLRDVLAGGPLILIFYLYLAYLAKDARRETH